MGLFSFFDKAKKAFNAARAAVASVISPKVDVQAPPDNTTEGFAYRVARKLGEGYFKRKRMSRSKRVAALCTLNALEFAFAVSNGWVPSELQLSPREYRVRNKLGSGFFTRRTSHNLRVAKLMSLDPEEFAYAVAKGWVPKAPDQRLLARMKRDLKARILRNNVAKVQ